MKTNAVRLLDKIGICYELREYEVDPNDLDAKTVAAKIGLPAEQITAIPLAVGPGRLRCPRGHPLPIPVGAAVRCRNSRSKPGRAR